LYYSFIFTLIISSDKIFNVKNSFSYNSSSSNSDTSSTSTSSSSSSSKTSSDKINYTSTDLKENLSNSQKPNLNLKGQLGYYLAGLIESEGAIIVPKENSKNNTPTLKISFHINDLEFAKKLIKTLGYGSIQMDTVSSNAFTVVIRSKEGLLDFISLINGKFRTPKINKLYSLIDYINKDIANYKLKDIIVKLPSDKSNLAKNSWLSGFASGDSSFGVRVTESENAKNNQNKISLSFELVQSRLDDEHLQGYRRIMVNISDFLLSNLSLHKMSKYDRSGKQNAFRSRITSMEGAKIVHDYFTSYPMMNSKHLDFLDWSKCYREKAHYKSKGPEVIYKIKLIKFGMNTGRKRLTWSHLNNMYER